MENSVEINEIRFQKAEAILIAVCRSTGADISEVRGNQNRKWLIVATKQIFCNEVFPDLLTCEATGNMINQDHSTVLHNCKTFKNRVKHEQRFISLYQQAQKGLGKRVFFDEMPDGKYVVMDANDLVLGAMVNGKFMPARGLQLSDIEKKEISYFIQNKLKS